MEIDSVTIVRFDIKMGEGFDVQTLSTRNIVSINQSENSGEFDVLTQDSIAYSFFEEKLTNGYDDYFDSWIRFDGSMSNVRINLGDNNVTNLLESSWLNRSPDFFEYSLSRISLKIENFSYSSNNGITTVLYHITWQFYGNVKIQSLVEPDLSTKYIMVTSDTLLEFPITNLTISFSLLFNEIGGIYEFPKKGNPQLTTGDKGIYNFTISENETQLLNSLMKENQDHKIDLKISSTLESGNKISSIIPGIVSQLYYQTSNSEVGFTKIVLEVFYLNIQQYFDTVNIAYRLGWFFKSNEVGSFTSPSNSIESHSQTNITEVIDSRLIFPNFVKWIIYTFFTITAIVTTRLLIKKLDHR